jgi:death-on-curing protein
MRKPRWILDDVVPAIHRRQLAEHGGSDGVRDTGLLASALARPKNLLAYSDPPADLAALAAAYAMGIAKNHPFIDGNKRTALVVCLTFLRVNGKDVHSSQADIYSIFLKLAEGMVSEADLAVWLRDHWAPLKK